jgi:hypothetical protein
VDVLDNSDSHRTPKPDDIVRVRAVIVTSENIGKEEKHSSETDENSYK